VRHDPAQRRMRHYAGSGWTREKAEPTTSFSSPLSQIVDVSRTVWFCGDGTDGFQAHNGGGSAVGHALLGCEFPLSGQPGEALTFGIAGRPTRKWISNNPGSATRRWTANGCYFERYFASDKVRPGSFMGEH